MIGIIPAAGAGRRMQPLGFSKELLPVGARIVDGVERPKAVSEYLVERMVAAGAQEICMIISAEKADIVKYYGERDYGADIFFTVQPRPQGLCDALFRATPFARRHEQVLIGLPDTIWFPEDAFLRALDFRQAGVNLVLFPSTHPSAFDAVLCDELGFVQRVQVKHARPASGWIWGAIATQGECFFRLQSVWESRRHYDEYFGDLLNAFLADGNPVRGQHCGDVYMDVGTLEGYRAAQDYLRAKQRILPAFSNFLKSQTE